MIKDFIENRVIIKHWTHFGFVVSRILELGRQGWKDIILETVNEHKTFEHVIQTFEAWGCEVSEKQLVKKEGSNEQLTRVVLKRIGALQK